VTSINKRVMTTDEQDSALYITLRCRKVFGAVFQKRLAEKGLSLGRLADLSGLKAGRIFLLMHALEDPSVDDMVALSKALELDSMQLTVEVVAALIGGAVSTRSFTGTMGN
jgi:hypothetical protein